MIKTGTYQHFKGNYYQVLYIARHSETEEYLVVYHPKDNAEDIWLRPLAMFDETIEREGKTLKRFSFIKP
ncbi:DUF1653 domain-containing protein [Colwellia psychrerythraea]|uniref:DUF1653-like domain containing protein n=1 Tax=Colwellia psychrerythraea TaxID=28229 RepID=A0A099KCI7_COLPS|nr:DUF1653 domain-containing protein [Colwellia psychrerythraea]KGJ87742.1 DUF1653-like domain containing protein [Colwellia psychrerythraea]